MVPFGHDLHFGRRGSSEPTFGSRSESLRQLGAQPRQEPVRPVPGARNHDPQDPAQRSGAFHVHVSKGSAGRSDPELKYSTDGKPVVNGENQGSAHWEDDKLVIETSRDYQGSRLTQREEWTLSANGKTLTIATHVTLPNGEFDVKQVFEKVQ